MPRHWWTFCSLYYVLFSTATCQLVRGHNPLDEITVNESEVPETVVIPSHSDQAVAQTLQAPESASVRNIILMIGDGMGLQQLGLLSIYAHQAPGSVVPNRTPAFEQMMSTGVTGLVRTEPHGVLVADSAAAATQLATGELARSEMIGTSHEGNAVPTILEIAKQFGKSTGLITDTRLTHATPAAFAAHQPHRLMENEIAVDMLENRVDVLLGGGLQYWVPEAANDSSSTTAMALLQITGGRFSISSKRTDNRNLLLEARADYQLVFDRQELQRVLQGRVLGLFANSEMNDALTEHAQRNLDDRGQPTHVEMIHKALDLLAHNPNGFFLMIEGGQIDWTGHNNDVGAMLHEMLQFDDAVRVVHQWAASRDDTLVLFTGDHETGSFGFSYSGSPIPKPKTLAGNMFRDQAFRPSFNFAPSDVLDRIYCQKKDFNHIFQQFDDLPPKQQTADRLVAIVNDALEFHITLDDAIDILSRMRNRQYVKGHRYLGTKTVPRIRDFDQFYVYGENSRMALLARAIADEQNVVWGSGSHTSTPVPIVAFGPAEATRHFAGMQHSTDIGQRMIELISGSTLKTPLDTAQQSRD